MKIQIVGSNKKCKTKIDKIIKDLPETTTVEELKKDKFNIKYPPAIIIDNVLDIAAVILLFIPIIVLNIIAYRTEKEKLKRKFFYSNGTVDK